MKEPTTKPLKPVEESQEVDVVNEEDWSDEEEAIAEIQLGFLEPVQDTTTILFRDPDWRNWDGGKVGGWPIWLDPVHLPSPASLLCTQCADPLCFLLQIYCPLDMRPHAFHRALYVFCCKKGGCSEKEGSVKVFRAQLPRTNPHFCYEPKNPGATDNQTYRVTGVCAVCGCKAPNACSRCRQVFYCHKTHQTMHWKTHKAECIFRGKPSHTPSHTDAHIHTPSYTPNPFCFEEQVVLVEPEDRESAIEEVSLSDRGEVWEDAMTPGGKDEAADKALGQRDYNAALSEHAYDKVYVDFLTRIDKGGTQQILRYISDSVHRDETPLTQLSPSLQHRGRVYVSETYKPRDGENDGDGHGVRIPLCEKCGAPRALECQIMPQLLYYLKVDQETQLIPVQDTEGSGEGQTEVGKRIMLAKVVNKHNADMTWGTLDIFTCTGSCAQGDGCGYVQEHVVIQALSLKA